MQVWKIVGILAGTALLGLIVLLLVETHSSRATSLSPEQRAKALAEYERNRANNAPPALDPAPVVRSPRSRNKAASSAPATESEAPPRTPSAVAASVRTGQLTNMVQLSRKTTTESVAGATEEVRSAYDTGDFVEAQRLSLEAIRTAPDDIGLLRYVVSSSCAVGDVEVAREHAARLPEKDRAQMALRCSRAWGAEL